jgi:hypothetical protein
MTCQLDPIFTTNNVIFSTISGLEVVTVFPTYHGFPAVPNSNTTLIHDITSAVALSLLNGQSVNGNTFVDFIRGLIDTYPGSTNTIVESMFQGMFEISGLSVNGYWSSKLFADRPPTGPFTREVTGNIIYTVDGWDRDVKTFAGLIPFTIVVIVAFLLLVWSYSGGSRLIYDPSGKRFA